MVPNASLVVVALAGGAHLLTAVPPRLSDWMGDLMPLIANLTVYDLTVVQTHNSASRDLTPTISNNCIGMSQKEADLASGGGLTMPY